MRVPSSIIFVGYSLLLCSSSSVRTLRVLLIEPQERLQARTIEWLEPNSWVLIGWALLRRRTSLAWGENGRAGNLSSAAPLPSIHGYGGKTVTVLLIVSLDGDLIDVFRDLRGRLRAGEWLLACMAMGKLVLAEHRPVRGGDLPPGGVALR